MDDQGSCLFAGTERRVLLHIGEVSSTTQPIHGNCFVDSSKLYHGVVVEDGGTSNSLSSSKCVIGNMYAVVTKIRTSVSKLRLWHPPYHVHSGDRELDEYRLGTNVACVRCCVLVWRASTQDRLAYFVRVGLEWIPARQQRLAWMRSVGIYPSCSAQAKENALQDSGQVSWFCRRRRADILMRPVARLSVS